ncbi:unnamed protein product [Prunus armeniaca]
MMQWQVNRRFRKDREAAIARIPNPDVVVQQLDLPFAPPPRLASGEEPFPSKNMRLQFVQKALHQFRPPEPAKSSTYSTTSGPMLSALGTSA